MVAIVFPTLLTDPDLQEGVTMFSPEDNPDVSYIFRGMQGGTTPIWDLNSSVAFRKVDVFLGVPGAGAEVTITVGGNSLTVTPITYTTSGTISFWFAGLRTNGIVLSTDAGTGSLGLFSSRNDPTAAEAVNFNLIG